MERVAGTILPRLQQEYQLIAVDQVPQMRMRMIGVHKPCLGHPQSRAVQLDCRAGEHMPVDVGVASEQAVSADNAGFNLLAGLHDREQRDHATQRKADMINRVALLLKHDI